MSASTGIRELLTTTAAILSEPVGAKEYEELRGKAGDNALYRPDRYRLRDIVEDPKLFALHVNGRRVWVRNFSISGLSFHDQAANDWCVGASARYAFELDSETVLEGDATVARVDSLGESSPGVEVGLIASEMMDYESLRTAEQNYVWKQGLQRERHIFRDRVPASYRHAVLELGAFCQYYKNLLGQREVNHREEPLSIAVEAATVIRPGWDQHLHDAAAAAQDFLSNRHVLEQARVMTETLVTPYMVEAPALRRAFAKPLGYPGDYALMQYYYENGFEGDSAFGMALHKIGNAHPLAEGVRRRSQWVAEYILERAANRTGSDALRVLSLGCGVGAEVRMVHCGPGAVEAPIDWLLIDQEDEALAVAYRNARTTEVRQKPHVRCVNVSFSQLLGGDVAPATWGRQDLIFALGLFDYLPRRSAATLIKGLHAALRPGGSLIVANATAGNLNFWAPELALRWSLVYRDEDEMKSLSASLPSSTSVHLETEPTGAYHILVCEKA